MTYFVADTRQITEELTLSNFHWELVYIGLNLITEQPEAEIEMWENHFIHRRKFDFIAPETYNEHTLISECISQLMIMPQFAESTLLE